MRPLLKKVSESVSLDNLMPLIRERVDAQQLVRIYPYGKSMLPMLREGRDSVTLSSPPDKLKKFDIALYQRRNGQYVLHRVVKIEETYTFVGDNQFDCEKGISHNQVIAICTEFSRDGKNISVRTPLYCLYTIFWHYSRFPRRVLVAIRRRIARVWKKK